MSAPDPVLAGIIPVNAPRPPKKNRNKGMANKKAPTKTISQDARAKHQTSVRSAIKAENFGTTTITREEIEAQFIRNKGGFHPTNKLGLSADDLKKDMEALADKLTAEPFPPTQYSIFTDRPKAPHTFLLELGYSMNSQDEVNVILIEDKRIGIKKLGPAIWQKVIEGRRFSRDRGEAFVAYLRYCADTLDSALKDGDKYNKDHTNWEKAKTLYSTASHLYSDQLSWELNLTDIDRRLLLREELDKDNEQKLNTLMDERLTKLGLLPVIEDTISE